MSPKILFLNIYCFKVYLFFIKEAVVLDYIFAPFQQTEYTDL